MRMLLGIRRFGVLESLLHGKCKNLALQVITVSFFRLFFFFPIHILSAVYLLDKFPVLFWALLISVLKSFELCFWEG